MSELRVILLILGALVLAAVYYFSRPRKPRQAHSRQGRRTEPDAAEKNDSSSGDGWSALNGDEPPPDKLKQELKRLGDLISREHKPAPAPRRGGESAGGVPQERPDESAGAKPEHDKIVVIYVRAREGRTISGQALTEVASKAGLEFGEMNIYHRLDEAGRREPIFSMANMVAPGTLDEADSPGFSTPGVALFLRLPGPVSALDAWDAMLATARRLSELLDAELLDESHSSLNRQRIQQLREEMREYDRLSTLEIKRR